MSSTSPPTSLRCSPGPARRLRSEVPAAVGLTVNIPLPAGATGDVVRSAIDHVARPTIEEFAPDWVLVSCGFDAHRADPLGELALSSGDFAELSRLVSEFVPRPGRLALFLEGGYERAALQESVAATLGALLGSPYRSGCAHLRGSWYERDPERRCPIVTGRWSVSRSLISSEEGGE